MDVPRTAGPGIRARRKIEGQRGEHQVTGGLKLWRRSPLAHFASDVWVLTKRSIARIRREPETLADVTLLHPELAVVCCSVAMLVVFAPLAVHLYRRKALG